MKRVAVYCGANPGKNPIYTQAAIDVADWLALPGGPGTLEEISEAFSWARVGQNPNPCAFYNVNGYYDKLADFFDHMVTEGFLTTEDRNKLLFSDSLEEIYNFMTR